MKNEHVLPEFAEPVTALPDQPNLPPAEMKRRLQAPADELRQAHNALAADHAALHGKVEGIVAQTYGGAIREAMLDEPLAAKLNGKAEQAALNAVQTALADKCEVYIGSYTGDGQPERLIDLGFKPRAVLVVERSGRMSMSYDSYGGLALPGQPAIFSSNPAITVTETGFIAHENRISNNYSIHCNYSNFTYFYAAFQ